MARLGRDGGETLPVRLGAGSLPARGRPIMGLISSVTLAWSLLLGTATASIAEPGTRLDVQPESIQALQGTTVILTAQVRDANGDPAMGIDSNTHVRWFFRSGSPNDIESPGNSSDLDCFTGDLGECSVSYTASGLGTDEICAIAGGPTSQCDEAVDDPEWDDLVDVVLRVIVANIPTPTPTPVATPTPVDTPTPVATPTDSPAATATPVATPAPTVTPIATPAPTATPTATPVETPAGAPGGTATPEATPAAMPTPAAEPAPVIGPQPPAAQEVEEPTPAVDPPPAAPDVVPRVEPESASDTPGAVDVPRELPDLAPDVRPERGPDAPTAGLPATGVSGPLTTPVTTPGIVPPSDSAAGGPGAIVGQVFGHVVSAAVEQVGRVVRPEAAVAVATEFTFPLALALAVLGFLVIQGQLDRRDPKLRMAPQHAGETFLTFQAEEQL